MRWSLWVMTGVVSGLGWYAWPEPAGACSMDCRREPLRLTWIDVVQVDGEPADEAPSWPEEGELTLKIDGTPSSVLLDEVWVSVSILEEG